MSDIVTTFPQQQERQCDDLDDMVAQMFSQPPGPPNSQVLDMSDHCHSMDQSSLDRFQFRLLSHILTRGILFKYGLDTSLDNLQPENIHDIRQYMQSLGFHIWVDQEIDKNVRDEQYSRLRLNHVLSIRHPPGRGNFHRIMFCRMPIA
jgi:hypothetical protein